MINKVKLTFLFAIFCTIFSVQINAQLKQGQLVDGIAAVVGNEIILDSDIDEQINYSKQQGASAMKKCEIFEQMLQNKFIVHEAKMDTLIENRSEMIREQAENKFNRILASFPDEKTMLQQYNFRTAYEMKNAIEKIDSDGYFSQQKYFLVTQKADVTPNEVTDFYNIHKSQFPEVKDEITIAQIMMYPKLTQAHKQELIDKLNKIKQDIAGGETFDSQARIYSEDTGSAVQGGLIKNITKGQMVKPFEAAALNLQEGEISEPIESEFGFHIIQLVKKSGKKYDAKHILLKSIPTPEEIKAGKATMDSIRTLITTGKMSFKEAAFRFSDDKSTKFNAGIIANPQDGSDRLERVELPGSISYELAGLNKGDITEPFEDNDGVFIGRSEEEGARKVITMIKVEDTIPAHTMTLESDYNKIKEYALNKKKGDMVEKWMDSKIPQTFITIDKRYDSCDLKSNWKKK